MPKPKDITGQRFGRLVVIRLMDERKNGRVMWECKCDCGNVALVLSASLKSGSTKSCGCLQRETIKSRIKDLTGQRFGKLVVMGLMNQRKYGQTVWECKCDCGNVALVPSVSLQSGGTKSCGCLHREAAKNYIKDLTGQRFEKLVVIRPVNKRSNDGSVVWECQCDCGNKVLVQPSHLHAGHTKSCGCFRKESHDKLYLTKQFGLIENTSVSTIKSEKARSDSQTGHRGVCYVKRVSRYAAYIGFKKKNYHLGYFNTLEEAVKVRKQAEEMLFEPFIKWYEENYLKSIEIPHGEDKKTN